MAVPDKLAWYKTDVANTLWQDSTRTIPATADADPVGAWDDLSGNGYHLLKTNTARPILKLNIKDGKAAIRFDGTKYPLRCAGLSRSIRDVCLFAVFNHTGYFDKGRLFRWGSPGTQGTQLRLQKLGEFGDNSSGKWTVVCNGKTADADTEKYTSGIPATRFNQYHVIGWNLAATRQEVWTDGLPSIITPCDAATASDLAVGGDQTVGYFLQADIVEMVIYPALTWGQASKVSADLQAKWGITATSLQPKQIVCMGNSLVNGNTLANWLTEAWPYRLETALAGEYVVWTYGFPSRRTLDLTGIRPISVDTKVATPFTRNIAIAWEITNDLFLDDDTDTNTYNRYKTLCQDLQAAGFEVIAMTCLPRTQTGTPANFETKRLSINQMIRDNLAEFADELVDIGNDVNIGQTGDSNDLTYYNADKVHLNATGHDVVYDAVLAKIQEME
jgi:lysophospholipase L1-like esterase